MDIRDYIGTGREYAVTTKELAKATGLEPRQIRRAVHEARKTTVILNMQDGNGYFMPTTEEADLVERWIKQETSRFINTIGSMSVAKSMLKNKEVSDNIAHFLEVMANV